MLLWTLIDKQFHFTGENTEADSHVTWARSLTIQGVVCLLATCLSGPGGSTAQGEGVRSLFLEKEWGAQRQGSWI